MKRIVNSLQFTICNLQKRTIGLIANCQLPTANCIVPAVIMMVAMTLASCHREKQETKEEILPPNEVKLTNDQFGYVKMDTAKSTNDQSQLTLNGKVSF